MTESTVPQPVVAYFSAEYAIADDLPIYAGGLGVLAADLVLEAGNQDRPFYGLGLVYHHAFTGNDPDQRPMTERLVANGFEPAVTTDGTRVIVQVPIAGRPVKLQAWMKSWGQTHLILLDARVDENDEPARTISDRLYAGDLSLQLAQEICLGFGGVAVLEAMGVKPDVYHLNEGHTALAGLAVVVRHLQAHPELKFADAVAAMRPFIVGTKHTILAGAGLLLDWQSVARQVEPVLQHFGATLDDLKAIAGKANGDYSDTKLLIHLARKANGVSELHVAQEARVHKSSRLIAITNGVFPGRWAAAAWGEAPLEFDDGKLWAIHSENRRQLLEHVHEQTGTQLDPERLTVVWARRMAAYKRPELLVSELAWMARLVRDPHRPVQFVVAGAANPSDAGGVGLMNRVITASRRPELTAHFAYLPHYNPISARFLVRGADLWLNTPIRGFEACGTSGMKASLNGAVQFSVSDGWVDEVDLAAIGWEVSDEKPSDSLFGTLEHEIAPLFYDRVVDGIPHGWIKKMRANMELTERQFTARRMLDDYYKKLYKA